MDKEKIKQIIQNFAPEVEFNLNNPYLEVRIPNTSLHKLAKFLKEDTHLSFDYLFCLSGVDWKDNMTVVYHLESTSTRSQLIMKANTLNRENPELDSLYDIWPTAEFQEREVYDLLGIKFINHPDLRRIFLEDGQGYPLRKDYNDDRHVIKR